MVVYWRRKGINPYLNNNQWMGGMILRKAISTVIPHHCKHTDFALHGNEDKERLNLLSVCAHVLRGLPQQCCSRRTVGGNQFEFHVRHDNLLQCLQFLQAEMLLGPDHFVPHPLSIILPFDTLHYSCLQHHTVDHNEVITRVHKQQRGLC
jgi:hypothetical protein